MISRYRGSILIVAMWTVIILTGLVLTLCYSMRVEAMAGANRLAQAQADAGERGAEQFLLSAVDTEVATPGSLQNLSMEARRVGDCLVWVVRPDWTNDQQVAYGLLDEAGKLDINRATSAMLAKLPGITQDQVDSIITWRGGTASGGANDDYYQSLPEPYRCKNGPLETVEELLLVKDITKDLLFGYDRNRNGTLDAKEIQTGGMATAYNSANGSGRGIFPFITVYGSQIAPSSSTPLVDLNSAGQSRISRLLTDAGINQSSATQMAQAITSPRQSPRPFSNLFDFYFKMQPRGLTLDAFKKILPKASANPPGPTATAVAKVNINSAPKEVLACLPGLESADADAIISRRPAQPSDPTDFTWIIDVLSKQKVIGIGNHITGSSTCYSGDVVAISGDGRAFRRCRVVISDKTKPARIIYRRDLTASGWPLPPEIRSSIRSGEAYQAPSQGSTKGGSAL